jgi:uncharacterized protein involved in exopolysaccharide biosynthesis
VNSESGEVSIKELFQIVWKEKWLIICITAVCALTAAGVAWMSPNKYQATIVLSPVTTNSASNKLGNVASQLGGLAALAGISVNTESNKAESVAVLQSQLLTERFIQEKNLLPILFSDQWDPEAKDWKHGSASKQRTLWRANEEFEKIRKVDEDRKTGLVTLKITWTDPVVAAAWANGLVAMTNDSLRSRAIDEAEKHVLFLSKQAAATDVAEVRTAIYGMVESEIKTEMLAKGPGDFALKVIDPAVAPERKTSPIRTLWILVGTLIGLVISFFVLYIRSLWRQE